MARTAMAVSTIGPGGKVDNLKANAQNGDNVNGDEFVLRARDFVFFFNDTGAARTVTITSAANKHGRTAPTTVTQKTLNDGEGYIFRPTPKRAWAVGNKLLLDYSGANVKVHVIRPEG